MIRLCAIALIGLCLTACGSNSPEAVANAFWSAAKANDKAGMVANSTADSAEMINKMPMDEGESETASFELGAATVSGERATVATTITDEDMTASFDTIVVQEEGAWKVHVQETFGSLMSAAMAQAQAEMEVEAEAAE